MNPNQADIQQIIQQGYSVDIGKFISRGWEIFKSNPGGYIGFLVVSFLIGLALGFVPGLGNIAAIVVSGPLNAGNFIVAFKIGKGLETRFEDFFKGFQNAYFLPVFLAGIIISLIIAVFWTPAAICYALIVVAFIAQGNGSPDSVPMAFPSFLGFLLAIFALVALLPTIYLSISYIFAVPLIVGKKMQAWPAMEASRKLITKQWFSFFGFSLVLGLINLAGLLACGLGTLLTIPLTICAVAAAYESIIGLPGFDPAQANG